MRNRRSDRIEPSRHGAARGAQAAGVPRLRQRRPGHRPARAACSSYKEEGKIRNLEARLDGQDLSGTCGIAHTRWATHGAPNQINAHPHQAGKVAVVHNGIIENYSALKVQLGKKGHVFRSETDTEVLAHLIDDFYQGDLVEAVQRALGVVEGTYGIAVIHADEPELIVGARKGSPLVVGIGEGVNFLASDVSAILEPHAAGHLPGRRRDGHAARPRASMTMNINNEKIDQGDPGDHLGPGARSRRAASTTSCSRRSSSSRATIRDAFRGRILPEAGDVKLGGIQLTDWELRNIRRIIILACGTSLARRPGRRVPARGVRPHPGGGGVRLASSATASRSSTRAPSAW